MLLDFLYKLLVANGNRLTPQLLSFLRFCQQFLFNPVPMFTAYPSQRLLNSPSSCMPGCCNYLIILQTGL